jgi:hypothetical protein
MPEGGRRTPAAPSSTVVSISARRWPSKSCARQLFAHTHCNRDGLRTIWPSAASRTCSRSCSDMARSGMETSRRLQVQAWASLADCSRCKQMSNQCSAWLRCCWRMVEVASGRRECHWRAGATGISWSRNAGTAHARLAQARHPGDAGTSPRNETGPAECANYCVCAVAATARVRHFARPIAGTTVPWGHGACNGEIAAHRRLCAKDCRSFPREKLCWPT